MCVTCVCVCVCVCACVRACVCVCACVHAYKCRYGTSFGYFLARLEAPNVTNMYFVYTHGFIQDSFLSGGTGLWETGKG